MARRPGDDEFSAIEIDDILSDPASVARMIQSLSLVHRSVHHYKAYKKGGRALDYALTGVEDLRRVWPSMIVAVVLTAICYVMHIFYDGDDPTTAVENELLRLLLVFLSVTAGLSFAGYLVHKKTGGPSYQNPDAFRFYFQALADVLGNHPQARIILDPDPDNIEEMQLFATFHFQLHEYLLSLDDDRAATYMWTSFCQRAPLVSRRRHWVEPVEAEGDRDSPVFAEQEALDQRQIILRRCFMHQFGADSEGEFQRILSEVLARAEEIRVQRDESDPLQLLEINLLGKPTNNGHRRGGLLGRLCEIADEGVTREHEVCETTKDGLTHRMVEIHQRLAQQLTDSLQDRRYADTAMRDMIHEFNDVFREIVTFLDQAIREHPLERQRIATGRGAARLETAEEARARCERCQRSIEPVIERRKALLVPLFKPPAPEAHADAGVHVVAVPDARDDAIREARTRPGIAEEVGRVQDVLTQGERWSDDDRGMITAFNEALHERAITLSVNPMSLRLLEAAMVVDEPQPVEHAGEVCHPVHDPMDLNLAWGHRSVPMVVSEQGRVTVRRLQVSGYFNPPVDVSDLDLRTDAGRQEMEMRHRCYREAARLGWLNARPIIPGIETAFEQAHHHWILPHTDGLATVSEDFNPGAISVMFGMTHRRMIQRQSRLPGQMRRDADRVARDLAKTIRRFVGHMDPLDIEDGQDWQEQLEVRSKNLAHLFHEGKNYSRFEHWICCDDINLSAFLQLNVEEQVKTIVILLAGPDFAKFTALSITNQLSLSALNTFMRAYVTYMQRHVNHHRPVQFNFYDPNRAAENEETYYDLRDGMFVEQLIMMTDLEPGSVSYAYRADTQQYEWRESDSRMRCFLSQHGRKCGIILNALATTLSPEAFARHSGTIRRYREALGRFERPDLAELVAESQLLVTLLNGSSARTDNRLLREDNDPTDVIERTFQRSVLASMRWLITFYRAQQHLSQLFWVVDEPVQQRALLNDMAAVNPESVIHVFDLENQISRERLLDVMPAGTALELLDCLAARPTEATRVHLIRCFSFLLVSDERGYRDSIRQYLSRNDTIITIDIFRTVKTMLDDGRIQQADAEQISLCFVVAIIGQGENITAVSKGETIYELYREVFPRSSVFQFCARVLAPLYNHDYEQLCLAINYLLAGIQGLELAPDADSDTVLHVLSADQNADVVMPDVLPGLADVADPQVRIHCEVLRYWVCWDHLRGNERHAQNYLVNFLSFQPIRLDEQRVFNTDLPMRQLQIRCRLTVVLLKAISGRQYQGRWVDINNVLIRAGMTYPEIGRGGLLAGPRMLFYLLREGMMQPDRFFEFANQLVREGQHQYMWSLVQVFYPRWDVAETPTQISANDVPLMERAADMIMLRLINEELNVGVAHPRTTTVLQAIESTEGQYQQECRNITLDYLVTYAIRYCHDNFANEPQRKAAAFRVLNRLYQSYCTRLFPALDAELRLDNTFPEPLQDRLRGFIAEYVGFKRASMVHQFRTGFDYGCDVELGRAWVAFKDDRRIAALNDVEYQDCPADQVEPFQQFIIQLARERNHELQAEFNAVLLRDTDNGYVDVGVQITYLAFIVGVFNENLETLQIDDEELSEINQRRFAQYQAHWDHAHIDNEQFAPAMRVPHLAQYEMHEQHEFVRDGTYIARHGDALKCLIQSAASGLVAATTLSNYNCKRRAFKEAWQLITSVCRLDFSSNSVFLPNFTVNRDDILDMLIALVQVPDNVVTDAPGGITRNNIVMLFMHSILGGQVTANAFHKLATELFPAWFASNAALADTHAQIFQHSWAALPDALRNNAGPGEVNGVVKAQLTMAYFGMLHQQHHEHSWRYWQADLRPYARQGQAFLSWVGVPGVAEPGDRRRPQLYLDDASYLSPTHRDRIQGCQDGRGFKQFMQDCINLDLTPRPRAAAADDERAPLLDGTVN